MVEIHARGRRIRFDHPRSGFNQTPPPGCPASQPVLKAAWKLKPPIGPSKSSTSPAKNKPGCSFDSIVLPLTSFNEIPPAVTSAFSNPNVPLMPKRHCLTCSPIDRNCCLGVQRSFGLAKHRWLRSMFRKNVLENSPSISCEPIACQWIVFCQ